MNHTRRFCRLALLIGWAGLGVSTAEAQELPAASERHDCESLLHLDNLTITYAGIRETTENVSYCYIKGILPPAIQFHVQLPFPRSWNSRFLKWGDGGT